MLVGNLVSILCGGAITIVMTLVRGRDLPPEDIWELRTDVEDIWDI